MFGRGTRIKPYVMTDLVSRTRRFQNPEVLEVPQLTIFLSGSSTVSATANSKSPPPFESRLDMQGVNDPVMSPTPINFPAEIRCK
jgi:hypothetical protein